MTRVFKPVSQAGIKAGDIVLWKHSDGQTKHVVDYVRRLDNPSGMYYGEYDMFLSDYGRGIFGDYNGEFCVIHSKEE